MQNVIFCTAGESSALTYAKNQLTSWGHTFTNEINESVTHILLPIPSLDSDKNIQGGPSFDELLNKVSKNATILGGNLPDIPCKTVDFLKDEYYLAENAAITAHCALMIATQKMDRTIKGARILVIGWGRIGKCLAEIIRSLDGIVTVAARKGADQATLKALGYEAIGINSILANKYDLIINTVPAKVLDGTGLSEETVLIDLASVKGISGNHVIWARGLPGKMAPESSGALIAKTALRYALGKE